MGRTTFEQYQSVITKPAIVMTRKISGLRLGEGNIHYFHDSAEELFNLLDLLQYRVITVLGGASVYHWCLAQGIVTDVFLTVEPVLINQGKLLLEGGLLQDHKPWHLQSVQELNSQGSTLLHYQP